MTTPSFRLYRKGGSEVLKEIAAKAVNEVGRKVASGAGDEAEFEPYTTDRAAASVSVPAVQQAKDGVLTKAAAAAGLEVRAK